jgi:hypothetical protein
VLCVPISTNPKRRQADVRQWDLKRMRRASTAFVYLRGRDVIPLR